MYNNYLQVIEVVPALSVNVLLYFWLASALATLMQQQLFFAGTTNACFYDMTTSIIRNNVNKTLLGLYGCLLYIRAVHTGVPYGCQKSTLTGGQRWTWVHFTSPNPTQPNP